ncbi:MAG TPA: DUF4148 domain-containing protein [Paraburkholderia sp.]|nr:DUF4148 domain-containing protein [Paraburkholderia sp.]
MKSTWRIAVLATGAAMVALSGIAAAQHPTGASGKTREQVRQELEQAYRDGLLPHKRTEYPPSEATIKRNKELYALRHPEQASQIEADNAGR